MLKALSDATTEPQRFEWLVDSLRFESGQKNPATTESIDIFEWEYKAATMGLLDAIVNMPENPTVRRKLRDELRKSGLDERMKSLEQRIKVHILS